MRLLLYTIILVISTLPISGALASQDETNALDYLPPSQFISGWVASGNEMFDRPERLGWLMGDGLNLLMEYEPLWYVTETYERGEDQLSVEIYQFENMSDAYGFYTVSNAAFKEQAADPYEVEKPYDPPPFSQLGTIRIINNEFLEGYQDCFYFRVRVVEEYLYDSGTQAALYLQSHLPGESVPAAIIGNLPTSNLVGGSERYIRGPEGLSLLTDWTGYDFLGFDEYSWKAVAGEYRVSGGKYYLLVLCEYEDEDTAQLAVSRLQEYFEDLDWETLIVSAMSNGIHPRAFKDEMCIAFWGKENRLWLLWDLENPTDLNNAIAQYDH